MHVRAETDSDREAVRQVNVLAFGGPDEADLVERLRIDGCVLASLVAVNQERVVGHILFTRMTVRTLRGDVNAVALAPMAVLPDHQRRQIGSTLMREGIRALREAGEQIVLVVGHPAFYPRFGFSADRTRDLHSPFSGPAFMALELRPGALEGVAGEVRYPAAFGIPEK